jgi:predicted flap endonuclease-1-like 5' DNA nuclease
MINMIAKDRLYLTADKGRLVREGDPDGAFLYCAPGDEFPPSAVERFKLVDGTIGKGNGGKEAPVKPNKEKQPGGDKEKSPDGDKGGTKGAGGDATPGADDLTPDDLTRVKYIGAASAAALVAAGISTIAAIAAIDPANPPAVEGMGARVNWGAIVESAVELQKAAEGAGGAGNGDAGQDES